MNPNWMAWGSDGERPPASLPAGHPGQGPGIVIDPVGLSSP